MRILFMGTPDFAVPTLQTLIASEHEVIGVVTQPDRPKGRGGKMQYSPVKETALQADIPVYQPDKVKDEAFIHFMRDISPDVIVVVAFGQILSEELLHIPYYGCINVHASLLPKLRGPAPIQWSVINGDVESGVTIQQMDRGIDTGDILAVKKYTLEEKETGGSLFERLSHLGGPLLLEVLKDAEAGTLHSIPQNHEEHTYAGMLSKATGAMDFSKSAAELERLVRGLNPWPSAFCFVHGKMLKIWEADVIEERNLSEPERQMVPGTVIRAEKEAFIVRASQGALSITSLQLEGKKRMSVDDFLRGYSIDTGTVLRKER